MKVRIALSTAEFGVAVEKYIPIIISMLSFVVAAFSLGWNVYRDVLLKPKLRVTFLLADLVSVGTGDAEKKITLSAVNMGPGVLNLQMIHIKTSSLWRILFRMIEPGIITYNNPIGGSRLPCKVDVGDTATFLFDYDAPFIQQRFTHIGIRDSFGRVHWAARRDVKRAKRFYKNEQNKANSADAKKRRG